MDGIVVIRKETFQRKGQELIDGNKSNLLYRKDSVEAMVDYMPKGTVGLYSPSQPGVSEMYYVLNGRIAIYDYGETLILTAGDFYSLETLDKHILFEVLEDSQELYISSGLCFDEGEKRVGTLMEVLSQLQKVDGDTMSHCERVKTLCMGIAHRLRYDQRKLRPLFYAARFHDVGKSKIPVEILMKPGRLTPEEYEIMKQHSHYTYEMIRDCFGEEIATIADEHHERLDGSGYPRGLVAQQIGLPARIICVADAYDAMVTSRPYHVGMTRQKALAELRRCQNTQFDPLVVDALEECLVARSDLFP